MEQLRVDIDPDSIWLCHTCATAHSAGKIPSQSRLNNLTLAPIPGVLASLNSMELRLVSQVHTFQTIVTLHLGQQAAKGIAISIPRDVGTLVQQLPRPPGDAGIVVLQVAARAPRRTNVAGVDGGEDAAAEAAAGLPQVPRRFNVRYDHVMAALRWLVHFNRLYESVTVRQYSPEELARNRRSLEEQHADPDTDDDTEMAHAVLLSDAPVIPADAMAQALNLGTGTAFREEQALFFTLARADGRPVSFTTSMALEALAFPRLYPTGKYHFGWERETRLTPSMYFRQRLMNVDPRFRDPLYMGFAVSILQHSQLRNSVSVALRLQQGSLNLGALRQSIDVSRAAGGGVGERQGALAEVADTAWAFMKSIRGTAAYWQDTSADVFAMIRNLGPPTWFVTFSADETGWDDFHIIIRLSVGVEITTDEEWAEYLASLDRPTRRRLALEHQVLASRHFAHRWAKMLAWLKSNDQPLGKLEDFFWRVEFQVRGSPHIHAMLWIRDAPVIGTAQGARDAPAFIDRYVSTQIPPISDDPAQMDLRDLVLRVQQHQHGDSCQRPNIGCRFGYPKEAPQENTRMRTNADVNLRRADSYVTKRGPGDAFTNAYNPTLLRVWRANMDIQLISNSYAAAAYCAGYMTKAETGGIRQAVREGLATLPAGSSAYQQLRRIGTSVLGKREISLQEQVYTLMGQPLHGSSRSIVKLGMGFPEHRSRILKTSALRGRGARDEEGGGAVGEDEEESAVAIGVYEYYAARPLGGSWDSLSLFDYVVNWEYSGRRPTGAQREVHPFTIGGQQRHVWKRLRGAVVRVYPRMSAETHGDEYYYSMLLLHTPWRSEEEEFPRDGLEERFLEAAPHMEAVTHGRFADQLHADVQRLRVLAEEDEGIYAAAAPGAVDQQLRHMRGEDADDVRPRAEGDTDAYNPHLHLERDDLMHGDDDAGNGRGGEGGAGNARDEAVMAAALAEARTGGAPGGRMTPAEFADRQRRLSEHQRVPFDALREHLRTSMRNRQAGTAPPPPFYWFITGGAGTGKSFVIGMLHELIRMHHAGGEYHGDVVALTAPTGIAARNIGGRTLHDLLKLPVEACRRRYGGPRPRVVYCSLGGEQLRTLRDSLGNLRFLIIDEISMVSRETMEFVQRRLSEIMDDADTAFGGVSIIVIGDFFQLPPVEAKFLFLDESGVLLGKPL